MKRISAPGRSLLHNKWAQVCEIAAVFVGAALIIFAGLQFVGENLFAKQLVIFVANLAMLAMVWSGPRIRKQGWDHFGLSFSFAGWRVVLFTFLKSLLVFVVAVFAFVLGAIVMANIVGIPEPADISGYNYLSGNLPLLIVSMVSIFFVSSFGEEVIYRAFLMTRISEIGNGTKWAVRLSVIISAVIFGIAHLGWGLTGIVQTTFMGLALSLMYLLFKRRLWPLVMAHAYMDALLIVPLYFAE